MRPRQRARGRARLRTAARNRALTIAPHTADMSVSLAEAAQLVGLHRSNLLRAIKAGRISGVRDDDGSWRVDESELVRVYGDLRSATLQPAQSDALLALKLEHAEQLMSALMQRAERAEREADDLREIVKRLALPAPSAPRQVAQDAQSRVIAPSTGMAPVHSPAPVEQRGWLRRWLRSTG
jgi:excisionase family DNA binding protein